MRKLCWWALSCCLALTFSVWSLSTKLLLPLALAGLLLLPLSRLFQGNTRTRLCCVALGLAFGFTWAWGYLDRWYLPALELVSEEEQVFTVTVADFPVEATYGHSYTARLELSNGASVKVRVYTSGDCSEHRPGDKVSFVGRASRSDQIGQSSTRQFLAKGLRLFLYDSDTASFHHLCDHTPLRYWPVRVAQAVKESLRSAFPEDVAGFLIGLLTGDKSFFPAGMYSDFQRSGLAHMVAVSGLHIGFLSTFLFTLFGRRSPLVLAGVLALIAFFVAATGNSPSALRSAWMTTLILLAPRLGREQDDATVLSVALLVLLLADPFAIFSVSLQLSFTSMAGLYFIAQPLEAALVRKIPRKRENDPTFQLYRKVLFRLSSGLSTSVGTTVLTAPIVAVQFQTFSLIGPVMNLLVLQFIPYLFLGGLFTALLGLLSPGMGQLAAFLLTPLVRVLLTVVHLAGQLPYAALSLNSVPLQLWFVFCYALLAVWLRHRRELSVALPGVCMLCGLLAAQTAFLLPIRSSELTTVALSVGQGASTLFYSRRQAALVDCGGSGRNDAGAVAANYLQAMGLSRLDYLILTHCHDDHTNGLPELLARVEVGVLILPNTEEPSDAEAQVLALAEAHNCKVYFLSTNDVLYLGSARLQLFPPLGGGDTNEEGLSLLCSVEEFDVLLTGDMDAATEALLLQQTELPPVEVLLVGHHGSKNASSDRLLAETTPVEAVISVGENNRYGHPSQEALDRLDDFNCHISRTDQLGNILIIYQGGS